MAVKLRDDQIKWILTVDAKGAQAEIQQFASSSAQLTEANKRLKIEMKKTNAQIRETEKEMRKLEKAGKADTDRYKELQATVESAKSDVADYTKRINENTAAINANDQAIQQTIENMKLEEMTMNQLKNRARELQSQLDNTAEATSPEAYRQLQEELNAVNERMGIVRNSNKGLMDQLSSIPGPAGGVINSIKGIGTAMKALIANPIGIVIMAIVAAFYALKTAIAGSDEASTKLEGVLNALSSAFDALKRIVTETVAMLYNFFTMDFKAAKQNLKNIQDISNNLIDNTKAAYDATLAEDELNDSIVRNNDLTEVNKARIEELRQITQDSTKALEERKKASDELLKLENENYKMAVSNISGQYEVWKGKNKNLIDAMKRGSAEQIAEVEKYMKMVQEGTELTYQQRLELANLVNDITTTLDKGTEEEKEKFRSFFSELSTMQEQYFSGSRRDQRRAVQLEEETGRENAQRAKDALEKRLQDEENALNQEINVLKTKRLEGVVSEKEYNKQVEQLTIDSLNKKLAIKGQEKDKLIQYNQQILDAQLKQQETADKELLEALKKEKEKELQLLEVSKNAQLEKLQEEETDRSIYALRAAEIESQAAEARLAVIDQFAETLKQAEFNNNQAHLQAIEENSKDILSAETSSLKQRENLQKQFAKTTADFEKQYNTKTWEQRREDELRILEKQYEAKLLSEETYQLAVTAIEKKYEDEKLKVREQYGIASMSELYNAEMEALLKQHEKGLLDEEEYEQEKLQLKLKYAQEYAQKAADFAAMASDAVSTLQSAEIANTEAKYDAEIQAAGDNKEEVERLENEKAKKKLDIEKKYADVQFAVTAAEIVANTAMAIMQAYSQLGPIAGTVAAVLMGITGAAQLAVANAQRQKVKQMSLSGSSSSETPATGQIKLKEGFAEGGSNTGDHTDGGYTGKGDRYDVAGWVPYHHGEYFVAVPEMKDPAVQDHVRAIDKIRRKRTAKNSLPKGFAEGGANMPSAGSESESAQQNKETNQKLLTLLNGLINGEIAFKTNYGVTEYQAAEKEKLEAESNFTMES
jgi:hypothetical protein